MVYLKLVGLAVQVLAHVMLEGVIVIMTHTVRQASNAETIIAERIFHLAIGVVWLIVV